MFKLFLAVIYLQKRLYAINMLKVWTFENNFLKQLSIKK